MLYEMVAGRSPFAAPSNSDVLAGILNRDPAPLARFEPAVSPELQRIVTKALRKNRDQRYQNTRDLLLDLQVLRDDPQGQSPSAVDSAAGHVTERGQPAATSWSVGRMPAGRHRFLLWVAALLALGVGFGVWWSRSAPGTRFGMRSLTGGSVARYSTRLTFGPGLQTNATWSPDGRSVAFASDQAGNFDIWVQPVAGGDAVQLHPVSCRRHSARWSPDGSSIVFRSEREPGGLFIVPAAGGPERQLTSFGVRPLWAPDGTEILFRSSLSGNSTLHAVSAGGGDPPREILQPFLSGGTWFWISSHPDGRVSALGLHQTSGKVSSRPAAMVETSRDRK